MKPFDLELALAGDPVVTRCGRMVSHVREVDCQIIAEVKGAGDRIYTRAGKYSDGFADDSLDLFMVEPRNELWVNVYRDLGDGDLYIDHGHPSEDAAKLHSDTVCYVKTIKIEV